jgi:NADPH-dependent F420 reductase
MDKSIAILGGTGKEGKGLAFRWAKAGYRVIIGSRIPEKAHTIVEEIKTILGNKISVEGMSNFNAARQGDLVVLTVPYTVHRETLELVKDELKGKILIDVTVPLVPPKVYKAQMPPAGSAAMEAHVILGEQVEVTSAFQNISSNHLLQDGPIECDVLVTGTSKDARAETLKLVTAAGLIGWDAGPLENSAVVEGLTSILIGINRHYGSKSVGIRITGVQATA